MHGGESKRGRGRKAPSSRFTITRLKPLELRRLHEPLEKRIFRLAVSLHVLTFVTPLQFVVLQTVFVIAPQHFPELPQPPDKRLLPQNERYPTLSLHDTL